MLWNELNIEYDVKKQGTIYLLQIVQGGKTRKTTRNVSLPYVNVGKQNFL